ncbi:MAG: Bifunctional protein PyrR [Gammaproteobacteria bacterium]|nr:Bifunctional protein PyrR [Gammaproteobacteria bacterium]
MPDKIYLSAQGLLEDSFRLGAQVIQSGFKPSVMIAIWRGGTPVGIAVQEILGYFGIETDHIAIRTSSYSSGIDGRGISVRIHGMNYPVKRIRHDDRLLIVDDVFDTGHTIKAVIEDLRGKARLNTPEDIRVAVPYYKPGRNETERVPDFYLHETESWIKFPHSLEGLTKEEIRERRPDIYAIVHPNKT